MNNLGGHDMPSVLEAFHNADPEKPTCFICYTVKGFGLPSRVIRTITPAS